MEPFEGLAPGGGVSAAHWRLEPGDQTVTGDEPAAGADFDGFGGGCGSWRNLRRREPVGAGVGEKAFGGGGG